MAPGQTEIIVIVIVVLLLFGATAIPKLARSMGRAKGEFQKARNEFESELKAGEKQTTDVELEARIRQTARDLEIPEEGRPLADVKSDLNERLN